MKNMKTFSIILCLSLILGLFSVNAFAYTRPENIVSEFNDFENGVGDWTNGLISGCANNGDVTESATELSVIIDSDTAHGKCLAVNNSGTLSDVATLMFDITSAQKTAASAQSYAEVKAGSHFGFEFDFKLPADASSSTALDLMVWDTRGSRNRYTLVKIVPSSGKVTAGANSYNISKDKWYKMKLECVVGEALQRFIIADDNGKELFVSNMNINSKYLPVLLYGFVTFSQGGENCLFYLDNTKAYTFESVDLNAGKLIFRDDMQSYNPSDYTEESTSWRPGWSEAKAFNVWVVNATDQNGGHPLGMERHAGFYREDDNTFIRLKSKGFESSLNRLAFEVDAHNDAASFTDAENPPYFVVGTKVRIDDTSKNNDIKISLIEEPGSGSDIPRLITTISPYAKTVRFGDSSANTVSGLSMESGVWYDIEIICNTQTDYQRVEITNAQNGETRVFEGISGYLEDDISAFDGVMFECTCIEDTVADFDDINIYTLSQMYAIPFYTMDSRRIEADTNEIIITTSAPLGDFSEDKVIFETDEGRRVPAEIFYDDCNTVTVIPSEPLAENASMRLTFSKDILVGNEKPKYDSVLDFKVLIKDFTMDVDIKADGESLVQAADISGKSEITCQITTTSRTSEDFSGIYIMSLMDKNGEIRAMTADSVSVGADAQSCVSALSVPVPGDGSDMEIYIMLIDNFQSSKAVVKYIKID